jgi:hypothetical protein
MNYNQLVTAIQDYTENQFPFTYLGDGTVGYNNATTSPIQQINRIIEQAELRIYNMVQIPSLRKNVTGTVTVSNPYLSAPQDYLSTYSLAVIDPVTGAYEYMLNKDVNFIRESYPPPNAVGKPRYYAIFGPQYIDKNELSFIMGPTPDTNYNVELHYYYYPVSIVQNVINSMGVISNPGSGYTDGRYTNLPTTTNGSGDGALLNITVLGGIVTAVQLAYGGSGYTPGDTLTCTIGTSGSGFLTSVGSVNNPNGTSWLGDNFDTVLLYGALVEAYTYMKGEADLVQIYNQKYTEALAQLKRLGDGLERGDAYRDGQTKLRYNAL